MDSYSEVTNVSWFSRLRQSITGVLVGILFFLLSFPIIYWNEGRAVAQDKALKGGAKSVISVPSEKVDSAHEGFLIHTSGKADSKETISDSEFVFEAPEVLMLKRSVEMYQWQEQREEKKRKKLGGGEEHTVTHSYHKVWSSKLIDSSGFKKEGYDNPSSMPYRTRVFESKTATVGDFQLGSLINQMKAWESMPVSEGVPKFQASSQPSTQAKPLDVIESEIEEVEIIDEPELKVDKKKIDPFRNSEATNKLREKKERMREIAAESREQKAERHKEILEERERAERLRIQRESQSFELKLSAQQQKLAKFKPHQGGYFLGEDPGDPQIGDSKVEFFVVRPDVVSILAQQSGQGFKAYRLDNKSELYRLSSGEKTAAEMFQQLEKENAQLTWVLRGVGFLLMTIGLASMFKPFVVMADVIPIFGNLLGYGVALFSLMIAVPLTLVTMAVGWFAARPLLAVALLLVAAAVAYGAISMSRSRKAS